MWDYYYSVNLDSEANSFDSSKTSENWVLMAYMALKGEFQSKIAEHAKSHMRNEKISTYPAFAIKALKAALEENKETPLVDTQANTQYIAEIHALLGLAYEHMENYEKAYKYYTRAGDLGKFHRACLLTTGQGTVSKLILALNLIKERAAAGDLNAQYAEALIMSTGRFLKTEITTKTNPVEGEAKFIQIADRNIQAAFTLAEIYLDRQDKDLGKVLFMIKGEPLSEERQQKLKALLEKVATSDSRYSKKAKFYLYQIFPNEHPHLKENVLDWLKEPSNTSTQHLSSEQATFYSCYFQIRNSKMKSVNHDFLVYSLSFLNSKLSNYSIWHLGQKYNSDLSKYNQTKSNFSILISKFYNSDLIVISDMLRELISRGDGLYNVFKIIKSKTRVSDLSTLNENWFSKNYHESDKFFNYCYIALIITEHLLKDENKNLLDKNTVNDLRLLSAVSSISLYLYFGKSAHYDSNSNREKQNNYLKDAADDLLAIIEEDPNSEHIGLAAYLLSLLKSHPACKELLKDLKDAAFYMEMSKAAGFNQAIIALKPFPLVTAFKVISGAAAGTAALVAVAATSAASQVAQTVVASVAAARAPTPKPELDLGDVELAEIQHPSLELVINADVATPDVYEDADTDTNWPEVPPIPETKAPAAEPE